MQVQETVTRPHIAPRLGPAPARMGAAATVPVDTVQDIAAPLRAFPWIAKRFAIWSLGTILSATAFHLTGFVLIGVIAIVFPIAYWAKIIFDGRRVFGVTSMRWIDQPVFGMEMHTYGTPEYFRNRWSRLGY
jgi:hypothetical protein